MIFLAEEKITLYFYKRKFNTILINDIVALFQKIVKLNNYNNQMVYSISQWRATSLVKTCGCRISAQWITKSDTHQNPYFWSLT